MLGFVPPKTFKDKLTERANNYELDITGYVEEIKEKMQEHFTIRKFDLHLIKTEPNSSTIALGQSSPGSMSLFVPRPADPENIKSSSQTFLKNSALKIKICLFQSKNSKTINPIPSTWNGKTRA